ncbi:hypothetical protein PG991_012893 [Apiospora marii]|uniref:Uncharacterized protein n=1 Tax=Apiospora marii TaxID=335849 RepID=A0ABR1RC05_9PEZI
MKIPAVDYVLLERRDLIVWSDLKRIKECRPGAYEVLRQHDVPAVDGEVKRPWFGFKHKGLEDLAGLH